MNLDFIMNLFAEAIKHEAIRTVVVVLICIVLQSI